MSDENSNDIYLCISKVLSNTYLNTRKMNVFKSMSVCELFIKILYL